MFTPTLLLLATLAPTAQPVATPGDPSRWDSARDATRLAREYAVYELARGEDPEHGPTLDWSFRLADAAFADVFCRQPLAHPFGALRLVLRNEGGGFNLAVKLADSSGAEWTAPPVPLAAGGEWQTIDLPLGDFAPASWSQDRDGRLNFPLPYLAVIAFGVQPGVDYRLRIAELSTVAGELAPARLVVDGLPADPGVRAPVSATFELTLDADWPAAAYVTDPRLGLEVDGRPAQSFPIYWDRPATDWRAGETVRGVSHLQLSEWTGGRGHWRLIAPGLGLPADGVLGPVRLRARQPQPMWAEVRPYRGAPTLFINDQPSNGMAYTAYGPEAQVFAEFGQAGVRLYSICGTPTASGYGLAQDAATAPGVWDFSQLDQRIRMVLDNSPDSYLFPRLYLAAPEWWLDEHPEAVVTYDPGDGQPIPLINAGRRVPSWASRDWWAFVDEGLRRLIRFVEAQPYADRVIGYHLASGTTEEWMMWGANDDHWTDYSPATTAAWDAWRTAAGRPVVPIPTRSERAASAMGNLRDPATDQASIDYSLFLADHAADAMEHFAATVKRLTERRRTVGVFYGYLYQLFGQRQQNAAHLAFDRIVRSRDIDFLCSPTSYAFRDPGSGTSHFMAPIHSVAAHGKLWFNENDIRTSLSPGAVGDWGKQADVAGDIVQQDRELANVFGSSVAQWWFDVGRNRYDDPALMGRIGELVRVADQTMAVDRSPRDQIAMVADGRGLARVNVGDHLTLALMLNQIPPLSRVGGPVGYYDASDLDQLSRHRLIVLAPLYDPTPAQRAALERLKSDGRVIVFTHAPAPYRDGAWAPETMAEVCGLQLRAEDRAVPASVTYTGTDPLVAGLADPGYGPGMELRPAIVGADPEATVLGTLPGGSPGLLVRRYPTWTAVWSAAPTLPQPLLARLADLAGVHRYTDSPDVVWANGGLLALNVDAGGSRTLRLPRAARVTDLFSGERVGDRLTEWSVDLPAAGTALYRVDYR